MGMLRTVVKKSYCRADAGARHVGLPKIKCNIAAASTELTVAIGSFGQSHRTIWCFGRSITRHDPAARPAREALWDSPMLVETVVEDDAPVPNSVVGALSTTSTPNSTRTVAALPAKGETR